MTESNTESRSATELENLWEGEFGDAYVTRNASAMPERAAFWAEFLDRFPSRRILEVGCAHGANLEHLARWVPAQDVWGADINQSALAGVPRVAPGANAVWGLARDLPFRDRLFDLVFTVGLLIHQPDSTLPIVMNEILRCSNRWVLSGEYHADETTDINYRGVPGILYKRDYGRLYRELVPGLELREEGFLTKEQGFDRVTYQVFERVGR